LEGREREEGDLREEEGEEKGDVEGPANPRKGQRQGSLGAYLRRVNGVESFLQTGHGGEAKARLRVR
jgi:hypothetical protein